MNQILYTGENNGKINRIRKQEEATFPMAKVSIVLIALILFFSFNIYAKSENKNIAILEKKAESKNDIQNISKLETITIEAYNNVNTNNTNESKQEIEENKIIQEEPKTIQEQEKQETDTIKYTTSNGKNYEVIGKLNIPSLNIEYPILSTTSTELLKISLNKYWGANPNEVGNMVVVGHNYENSKFFSKLPNIQIGEIVNITDTTGKTLSYSVYDTNVIDPYDNTCTSQLTDGNIEITLITCYNNGKQRFVAKARAC